MKPLVKFLFGLLLVILAMRACSESQTEQTAPRTRALPAPKIERAVLQPLRQSAPAPQAPPKFDGQAIWDANLNKTVQVVVYEPGSK